MAALIWREDRDHNTLWAPTPKGRVGVGVLNRQWVIIEPGDPWYCSTSARLVAFKGRRRYPTVEAAMLACRLIYG